MIPLPPFPLGFPSANPTIFMATADEEAEDMVACDYFQGVIEYIQKILMEEDDGLQDFIPCMEQHAFELQATEKYFSDALTCNQEILLAGAGNSVFPESHRRNKGHDDDDEDDVQRGGDEMEGGHRRKQLAVDCDVYEPTDKYDKTFLCSKMNPRFYEKSPVCPTGDASDEDVGKKFIKQPEVKRGRPKKGSKGSGKEIIDFKALLTRAAKAASTFDTETARETLLEIRQHSSPNGDPGQRLAHCFAAALEARMAGTGSMLYNAAESRSTKPAQLLKCFQTYFQACPFKRVSNIVANKTIGMHVKEADRIHIVDFGIMYGFQWPCLIQGLSLKPGGPPRLKITGIDFPQPGLKPAARVEQTGRRLMNYCKRFGVPFEFYPIAKKWQEIKLEELRIEKNEAVVVNCMYRLRHELDESGIGVLNSPRDSVLNLVRQIRPCIFVHGVLNGMHGVPFFTTRFNEALHHYSCLFDMLEATIPREDKERQIFESEVFGSEIMNVIACEGSERVERPETYKQWQVRDQRAGFEQLIFQRKILQEVKIKVKRCYHADFLVEEDGKWMLQGWKGRVLYALSLWKPTS